METKLIELLVQKRVRFVKDLLDESISFQYEGKI